jgi:hypothetical protein
MFPIELGKPSCSSEEASLCDPSSEPDLLETVFFLCEVHKIGWILAHRVCGFLNVQPPIKVKLN